METVETIREFKVFSNSSNIIGSIQKRSKKMQRQIPTVDTCDDALIVFSCNRQTPLTLVPNVSYWLAIKKILWQKKKTSTFCFAIHTQNVLQQRDLWVLCFESSSAASILSDPSSHDKRAHFLIIQHQHLPIRRTLVHHLQAAEYTLIHAHER